MFFGPVPVSQVDTYWPICRNYLEKAVSDRLNIYTIDDYYQPLKKGELTLWVVEKEEKVIGAVLTSIDTGSAGSICSVHSLGGEHFKEWSSLFDQEITAHARAHRCLAIESITRDAFQRILPDLVRTGSVYTRLLEHDK